MLALALAAVLSAVACGSSPSGSATPASLTSVTADLSFPYAASQWNCVYDYGKSKGFFSKHGIDPTFDALLGSVALIDAVAAGKVDIGLSAAVANVVQAVSKGAPVKLIGVQERDSPNAVISLSTKPINKPADVSGKKIAYSPTSLSGLSFALLEKQNGISASSVHVVDLQPTAYASALQSGQIDGYISYPSSSVPNQEKLGGKPVVMLLRDFGVNPVPADGYIATDSMIKSRPEVLKNFLAGVHDTWSYLYQHKSEAAQVGAVCAKDHQGINAQLAQQQIELVLDNNSKQLSSASFMGIDATALQKQIDLLHAAGQLPNPLAASSYFTNSLLPPGQ